MKSVSDAHTSKITGLALIPLVNQLISAGGFELKIWSRNLELLDTLTDSKSSFSGRVIYKESDHIIGAINLKGIVFWRRCEVEGCQVCKDGFKCYKCRKGYKLNDGVCKKGGSTEDPIKWHVTPLNLDKTLFKLGFTNVDKYIYSQIREKIDPAK